jgi:hypothetical protein
MLVLTLTLTLLSQTPSEPPDREAPLVSVGLPIANPPPPGIPFALAGALGVTSLWD